MPVVNPTLGRTSTLLSSQQQLQRVQNTQRQLAEAEAQISTGRAITRPSDAPEKIATVQYLDRRLAEREQEARNLDASLNTLNTADTGLGQTSDILIEAKTIASSQVGVGSDAETRKAEALVIDAQVDGLLEIANTQFADLSVYGGRDGAAPSGRVFEPFLGGVRYVGAIENLRTHVGAFEPEAFTSNGLDAFGALSARVRSSVDLAPVAETGLRLADVGGALGQGVRPGSLQLTVNGTAVDVDLTFADSLGDVAERVNRAIDGASPGAGALVVGVAGFEMIGNGGNTVSLADAGNGTVAADLGLNGLSSTGGVVTIGGDVRPRLIPLTALGDLATPIDFASGITVTQGEVTQTLDFSDAETVQDLQNVVENAGLGLRLQINAEGRGLDLVSEVAGLELSIGENGGTTAADLGLRSFGAETALSDFRHGVGVHFQEGEDDLSVTLHDGSAFGVNLDGAETVGDVVAAVQDAAAAAGLTPGQFNVSLATTGNGFVFTDNTAGPGSFSVGNANQSLAGTHLGVVVDAGAASVITGTDEATVRVENAFTHLMNLRDALTNDDESGITVAGTKIEDDIDAAASARASVGVQAKRLEDLQTRAEDETLQEQSMLSQLQDADLAEVISRYQQLQLQLQASLQTTAQSLQLSLLDYLN